MERYWDLIEQIAKESDIILEILDARAVDFSRNRQLEEVIENSGKPRIVIINKADLISRKEVEQAADKLARERKTEKESVVHFSSKWKSKSTNNLFAKIRRVFSKYGKRQEFCDAERRENPSIKKPYREAKADIVIGVVGYPNVGKSSVINALCFRKKASVSSRAGTTHGVHWLSAAGKNSDIKLIDTPGVLPLKPVDEINLGLIAAKNPEKLKEPELVAGKIIENFIAAGKKEWLEKFYNLKINEKNLENPYLILEQISLDKGHLRKGGLADEHRTAMIIIKDWQTGRLKL